MFLVGPNLRSWADVAREVTTRPGGEDPEMTGSFNQRVAGADEGRPFEKAAARCKASSVRSAV